MNNDRDLSPPELTDADLDQISGGIDIFLSGSLFDQQRSVTREIGRGRISSRGASNTFSSAFQFAGFGFQSVDDVLAVLRGLANLFGRRN